LKKLNMSEEKKSSPLTEATKGNVRRWKKGRVLSKSLYGHVRYGKDTVTDRWVVIKECKIECVAKKRTTEDIEVAEDIYKEMELHGRLSEETPPCPYIIKLLDVCQDADYIYIVLEYAESGDLFGHVTTRLAQLIALANQERNPQRKKQLFADWHQRVRTWMKQILTAVQFMHARGICHRDLSLENVMLDADMNAKVIDFGCGHHFTDNKWSTERGPIGKIQYMSKECYAGHYYDARDNDMWCVGVMLWMALIGAPPWELPADSDMRYTWISTGKGGIRGLLSRWKRLDYCPEPAMDLLGRIFRKQKDRITVTEALNHPFITGNPDKLPVDLFENFPGGFHADTSLCEKWHGIRYTEEKKVAEPPAWANLKPEKKTKIQKFIADTDKRLCIFDRRVVQQVMNNYDVSLDNAHDILIFFMAASRGRLKEPPQPNQANPPRAQPRRDPFLLAKRSEEKADRGMEEDPQTNPHADPPAGGPRDEDMGAPNLSPQVSRSMESDHKENSDVDSRSSSSGQKDNLPAKILDTSKDEEMEAAKAVAADDGIALRATYKRNDNVKYTLTVKKSLTLQQIKFSFALGGAKDAGVTFVDPQHLTLFVNDGTKLTDPATLREGWTIYGVSDGGARDLEMSSSEAQDNNADCPLNLRLGAMKRGVTGESENDQCAGWLQLLPEEMLHRLSRILTDSADDGQALLQLKQIGLTEDQGAEAISFFSKAPESPGLPGNLV